METTEAGLNRRQSNPIAAGLKDTVGACVKRQRAPRLAQRLIQFCQVVQAYRHRRVISTKVLLANCQCLPQQRQRLAGPLEIFKQSCKVAKTRGTIRVLGSEGLLLNCQGMTLDGQRLSEMALRRVELCEVIQGHRRVGALGSQNPFPDRKRPQHQRFGQIILPEGFVEPREVT